jgi:hypothetical protein
MFLNLLMWATFFEKTFNKRVLFLIKTYCQTGKKIAP